ncbi:hypothetical protein U1Q18_048662 [Sarracenia purpurea var. burkii]
MMLGTEVANEIPVPRSLRLAHEVDIMNEVDEGVETSAYEDTTLSGTVDRVDDEDVLEVSCWAFEQERSVVRTYCGAWAFRIDCVAAASALISRELLTWLSKGRRHRVAGDLLDDQGACE